jgi:phytoene synthase
VPDPDPSTGAAAGSLRYYAVLFSTPARRDGVRALYSVAAEIERCVHLENHDVAHTRLQWWRQELDRLAAGHAQHPVTRALKGVRAAVQPDQLSLLQELTVAADLDLARFEYPSWQTLAAYCFRASGSLQTVIAATLASPVALTDAEREFARRVGLGVRQTEMLRDLAHDAADGRCYVPREALEAHGLDLDTWRAGARPDSREALHREWLDRVTNDLRTAGNALGHDERARQRHGIVLRDLHLRLLDALRTRKRENSRTDITAWTKLWTAWRAAVRSTDPDRTQPPP